MKVRMRTSRIGCAPSRTWIRPRRTASVSRNLSAKYWTRVVCVTESSSIPTATNRRRPAIESLTGISGLTNPSRNYNVDSPYGNVLYCAVIDGETDRVVHFVQEVPTLASHPEETADVNELLHKLLKEFIR